jgi:hypothetical protein
MEDQMKKIAILLTLVLSLLLSGNLMAMQGPSSTVRMTDLTGQSPAYQTDDAALNGNSDPVFTVDNWTPDARSSTNNRYDGQITESSDVNSGHGDIPVVPPDPVPEPTTLILLGLGMAGAAILRRKK